MKKIFFLKNAFFFLIVFLFALFGKKAIYAADRNCPQGFSTFKSGVSKGCYLSKSNFCKENTEHKNPSVVIYKRKVQPNIAVCSDVIARGKNCSDLPNECDKLDRPKLPVFIIDVNRTGGLGRREPVGISLSSISEVESYGYVLYEMSVRKPFCNSREELIHNADCYEIGDVVPNKGCYNSGIDDDGDLRITLDRDTVEIFETGTDGYYECIEQNPGGDNGDRYNENPPDIPTCEDICYVEDPRTAYACMECICAGERDSTEFTNNVWTELGCITPTQEGVISAIMRVFFGIVTMVALVRFVQAAIYLNSDDPEKKKEGKSIVMSAMAALALGASLPVVLNFLGIDILGIGSIV